jgi:hypothetical protein
VTKTCAYCDTPGRLTKDHVWPECFLDKIGRGAHFSHQTGRAHGGDYVVADVCDKCNNAVLSELDAYFCRLYDDFLAEARDYDSVVSFHYDYHLLTRSLLKIAYNSARGAGSDDSYLRQIRSYILRGAPVPTQLAVFAELVSPTLVADSTFPSGKRLVLPSGFYRSAITQLLTPHGSLVRTRIVAVNSFYFHLVFPNGSLTDTQFEQAAAELGSYIAGVVRLTPTFEKVLLKSSPQDAISSAVPHIQKNRATYRDFFRRRKS